MGGSRMSWKDRVAAIIRGNLAAAPISAKLKEEIVSEELDKFENPPAPEEKKPEDEPLVRGEKLSALRERAHKWGGWESWK